MEIVLNILRESWALVLQSGVYLLGGFVLAGLIREFLPADRLSRWLGGRRWPSVFNAALIGTPLPLCSCAVVPMAAELRRKGASRGATTALLISTPESGVESIAATYALMDPVMTIARPVSAFSTALIAGIAQNMLESDDDAREAPEREASAADCSDACGCPPDADASGSADHAAVACRRASLAVRFGRGLRYGVVDMFEDLAGYLAVGFLVAGLLAVLLTQFDPLRQALDSPWAPLLMLVAGVPMYVCAAAVTPMVAVLISQGLSPGAGLVFLLAGPATNAASLVMLRRILGGRALATYLVTIVVCSLAAGYAVDGIYRLFALEAHALTRAELSRTEPSWLDTGAAAILLACTAIGYARARGRRLFGRAVG